MIYLYAVDIDNNFSRKKFEKLLKMLNNDIQVKIERLRRYDDFSRTIMGEFIAKLAITEKFEIRDNDIYFEKNDYGKPFVKGKENVLLIYLIQKDGLFVHSAIQK